MKVITIPTNLEGQYHGCGLAAGKIVDGKLISFRYLTYNDNIDADEELGMLSCYQFCYDDERVNKEYENV